MLVPVYARALESKKKKPVFYDETTVRVLEISSSVLDFAWIEKIKNKEHVLVIAEEFARLCPVYKMSGEFNLTDTMKHFSPIFISLIAPMLRSRNNRIGCFEK